MRPTPAAVVLVSPPPPPLATARRRQAWLPPFELGLAFLREGGETLACVFGGECEVERPALGLEPGREGRLVSTVDRLFRQPRGNGALLGDRQRHPFRLIQPGLPSDDPRDEPRCECLTGREPPAAQDHLHGECLAYRSGPPLGAAGSRRDPEARP